MRFHHVALISRSEGNADRFYGDLLGFEKTRSFTVSADLSKNLFGFDRSYKALTYIRGEMNFEIFLLQGVPAISPHVHHIGLEVENLGPFLDTCREMQVQIMEARKGEKTITMIKDFDGNIFEIKESTQASFPKSGESGNPGKQRVDSERRELWQG